MTANVIAWPGSPQYREQQASKLQRLQQMEEDLARGMGAVFAELQYLRAVAEAAAYDMRKVAEHERRGYDHIKVGAFKATREALEARP